MGAADSGSIVLPFPSKSQRARIQGEAWATNAEIQEFFRFVHANGLRKEALRLVNAKLAESAVIRRLDA